MTFAGRHVDLHNNFEFVGYSYDVSNRQLMLNWKKSRGEWVNEDEFDNLHLAHFNITYLNMLYENKGYEFPDDDNCLSDISFFPSLDRHQ